MPFLLPAGCHNSYSSISSDISCFFLQKDTAAPEIIKSRCMFFIIFSNGDGRGKEWLAKNLLMEQKKPGENADIGKYWLNFYADNSTDFSVITGR
jgi:hypothetical protein